MAEVVESMPKRGNGKDKYPWAEWLDGRTWKLTRGQDFTVQTAVFQQAAWQAARARKIKVITRRDGDCVYVAAVL